VTYLVQATKRLLSLAWLWMCTQPNNDTMHTERLARLAEGSLVRKTEKEPNAPLPTCSSNLPILLALLPFGRKRISTTPMCTALRSSCTLWCSCTCTLLSFRAVVVVHPCVRHLLDQQKMCRMHACMHISCMEDD
jgi:hypothetical protein